MRSWTTLVSLLCSTSAWWRNAARSFPTPPIAASTWLSSTNFHRNSSLIGYRSPTATSAATSRSYSTYQYRVLAQPKPTMFALVKIMLELNKKIKRVVWSILCRKPIVAKAKFNGRPADMDCSCSQADASDAKTADSGASSESCDCNKRLPKQYR